MTQKIYPPTIFFTMFPNKEKKSDNHPDFNISAKVGNEFVSCGAAWKKVTEKGTFVSISIDVETSKKLIIEKLASLTSAGTEIPFTDTPEAVDPFADM